MLLQGRRGEGVADDVRGQVLGKARADGDLVEQALGAARPVRLFPLNFYARCGEVSRQ